MGQNRPKWICNPKGIPKNKKKAENVLKYTNNLSEMGKNKQKNSKNGLKVG